MNNEVQAMLHRVGQHITKKPNLNLELVEHPSDSVEKVGKLIVFWPEDAAAMPTELTRVSLFGLPADKPGARKFLDDVKLDSRSDIEILYTGKELSAKDETAWLAMLRIGRGQPMGQRIYLNKIDLLRECGLSNTGPNWKRLSTRLDRLSKAHFTINFRRGDKTYHMTTGMMKWGVEETTGAMYIRLDSDGAALFDNLAYQPWEVRLSLQSDVAARVLSYISGHEQGKPHSVILDDLRRWCGYRGRLRQFRSQCLAALHELEDKSVLVKSSAKILKGAKGDVACWVRERTSKPLAVEPKV